MRLSANTRRRARVAFRRAPALAPAVALATVLLLVLQSASPTPAYAADLFPIDDWIGDGLKSVGKIVLGPLKLTAEGIAHLLGAIVAALADLLIPKSFVRAGLGAIRWLVQLPPLGTPSSGSSAVASARMPHLRELRETLTWIGLTLLPLQIVVAGGRAFLSPTADGDAPGEVVQRTLAAAMGLLAFEWMWGAATHLVSLITSTLLGLPWVADGVERMLQSLVIGGAGGTAVAAEFVVPLVLAVAGAVLLALMLLRIGLEVIASVVYVTGGLALGVSVSGAGHRILQAWLVAATAVFVLPVLWCVVFVTGAALMVDAGKAGGHGFGAFVGQLYNVGAAIVTFGLAIKLARATLGHAGTAIGGFVASARISGGVGLRGARPSTAAPAAASTPQSLVRFSQQLRGGVRGASVGMARVGMFPLRHPSRAAAYAGHPAAAARDAASHVRNSTREGASHAAHRPAPPQAGHRRSSRDRKEPRPESSRESRPATTSTPARGARPQPPAVTTHRVSRKPPAPPHERSVSSSERPASAPARPPEPENVARRAPRTTTDATAARAWQRARRVVAPRRTSKRTNRRRKPS